MSRGRLLAAALIAASCALLPDTRPPSPYEAHLADPEALQRGKGVFVGMCGGYCHGLSPGNRAAPDLFDCEWKHGGEPEQIYHTISNGVPNTPMISFAGKLPGGDPDIWKIVAFLKSSSRCPK